MAFNPCPSKQELWNEMVSRSLDYSSPPEDFWFSRALSSSSHHEETCPSKQELWNEMVSRSFDYSSPPEDFWFVQNMHSLNKWGEPIPSSESAWPDIVDSFPFISYPTTNIWYLPKPSNKSYSCKFPPQDNSTTKPDEEDISSLATDDPVYVDAAGMTNITCDGGSNKPAADVGSIHPPGDVGSLKPPGDIIPYSGNQDECHAHDGSQSARYMCGGAGYFSRQCSLGCDCGDCTS